MMRCDALVLAGTLAVATGCLQTDEAYPPDLYWEFVADIPMDEPWAGGPTPGELIAALASVPGDWQRADTDNRSPMSFSAVATAAAEHRCTTVEQDGSAGTCGRENRLFFTAEVGLSSTDGTWAVGTTELTWDGAEFLFTARDEQVGPDVLLPGPAPVTVDVSSACSEAFGFRIHGSVRLLSTDLVATCADGREEEILEGAFEPDSELMIP